MPSHPHGCAPGEGAVPPAPEHSAGAQGAGKGARPVHSHGRLPGSHRRPGTGREEVRRVSASGKKGAQEAGREEEGRPGQREGNVSGVNFIIRKICFRKPTLPLLYLLTTQFQQQYFGAKCETVGNHISGNFISKTLTFSFPILL